jgi:hypothetical protein
MNFRAAIGQKNLPSAGTAALEWGFEFCRGIPFCGPIFSIGIQIA